MEDAAAKMTFGYSANPVSDTRRDTQTIGQQIIH